MAHYHFLEKEVIACKRWSCTWENRVEDVMDAVRAIDRFKAEEKALADRTDMSEHTVSIYVSEVNQKSFEAIVPAVASKEAHRKALWSLALVRWSRYKVSPWADSFNPGEDESLPPIFSYVDNEKRTVYFFKETAESKATVKSDSSLQPHAPLAEAFDDNGATINVVKITPAAAKKLFS